MSTKSATRFGVLECGKKEAWKLSTRLASDRRTSGTWDVSTHHGFPINPRSPLRVRCAGRAGIGASRRDPPAHQKLGIPRVLRPHGLSDSLIGAPRPHDRPQQVHAQVQDNSVGLMIPPPRPIAAFACDSGENEGAARDLSVSVGETPEGAGTGKTSVGRKGQRILCAKQR